MTLTTPPIAEEPNSKRRRPAKHFDALRGQRVDRDGVVGAGRRQVEAADAVGQHAHAVARQAAQHRRGGGRAEAGRADARLAGERLADARADFAGEVGLIENRDAAEHVLGAAADAGDDDFSSSWSCSWCASSALPGVGRPQLRRAWCRLHRPLSSAAKAGTGDTGNGGREGQAGSDHQSRLAT